MSKPYLRVIAAQMSQALHILDRSHITSHLNDAVDQVRRAEGHRLQGRPQAAKLKRMRWKPMRKVARMLRSHEELILNWFRAKGEISHGPVESLNKKIRVVTRRSYGFRTYHAMETGRYIGWIKYLRDSCLGIRTWTFPKAP